MEKFKTIKIASILGIIFNIFLLIIKSFVGFITGSQAMVADAFNSAGDIFSSVMTFIGNKIASVPSDDDHNLGHGKAEYIYSMLISIFMVFMALVVLKDSFDSILNHGKYQFSIWLIIVCITTIIIKLFLYLYTHKLSKKYNNLLIEANSKDHRNDCLVTLSTLIASILAIYKIYIVDGIVGACISLWMIIEAFRIFKKSYDVLMDKAISKELKDRVYEIIGSHEEVKQVIHFNSAPVGYRYQISFTICLDGNMSTFESHDIANKLEKEIDKKIDEIYLTVIHVNPMNIGKTVKDSSV